MSLNQVQLIGNLANDPDVKYASNGNAICSLCVACNEKWTDKNTGQKKEKAEFINVSLFGKVAEIAGEYARKGSKVFIQGSLKTDKYLKNGVDTYSTKVVLSGYNGIFKLLGEVKQKSQEEQKQSFKQQPPPDASEFDDDIPF